MERPVPTAPRSHFDQLWVPTVSVTSPYGAVPGTQRTYIRAALRSPCPAKSMITDSGDRCSTDWVKFAFGTTLLTATWFCAQTTVASPPMVWNVRLYSVLPASSVRCSHPSGVENCVGDGACEVLAGAGTGEVGGAVVWVGEGAVDGAGGGCGEAEVGTGDGTTASRNSAAESGVARLVTAEPSAELIPNQALPTTTLVARAHARGYTNGRRTPPSCLRRYGLTMATVLLVEDDYVVRGALLRSLTDRGHTVHAVGTALEALRRFAAEPPDLVVLDLGLPDLDGADALRMLRGMADTPIIVATARDDEAEIVRLLKAGADDYMVKPFTSAHLDARVTSVLRRAGRATREEPTVIDIGGLRVDIAQRQASLDDAQLTLTRKEFDLLAYLAARPGRVVSRRELLEEVWHQPSVGEDQTIDVHLYWLRRKLGESASAPRFLHTVRGVGFKFAAPG